MAAAKEDKQRDSFMNATEEQEEHKMQKAKGKADSVEVYSEKEKEKEYRTPEENKGIEEDDRGA